MQLADDRRRQQQYFDVPQNRYPRSAILMPPLHTKVEMERVLDALRRAGVDDGPIVDFGAGTGRLTIALARAGYRVLAIDVSGTSLDVLDDVARELGLRTVESATSLPRGEFSAVVGSDVLHHVDTNEYLPRLYALLRPGGTAVFSEPGALNPSWYTYLPFRHDMRIEARIVTCNTVTLRRRFCRNGFRDVRITGLGVLPRPLFGSSATACRRHDAVGNWPILKWFAYRYIIEATR